MQLPKPLTPIAFPKSMEDLLQLKNLHKKFVDPEMLGIHATNGQVTKISPSRSVMFTQHLPQHLTFEGIEPPYVLAGPESELAKSTFATRMPANGTILRVIDRYRQSMDARGVRGVPEKIVIYRDDYGRLGYFPLKKWSSYHSYFGFVNKMKPEASQIAPNRSFAKGTVFCDTPAVTDEGLYGYGKDFETAFMDLRATAEDGIIVSKSAIQEMGIDIFEERSISFGSKEIPINLYGGDNIIKIMPDIGESVRPDGLLMAVRPWTDRMNAAMTSVTDLREVNHYSDRKLYTRETIMDKEMIEAVRAQRVKFGFAKVIDIVVIRNINGPRNLPPTLAEQLDRYADANVEFYQDLLKFETEEIIKSKKLGGDGEVPMTPQLNNLLEYARAIAGGQSNRFSGPVNLQENCETLDEYTIKFTIHHRLYPNIGWKMTGGFGDRS